MCRLYKIHFQLLRIDWHSDFCCTYPFSIWPDIWLRSIMHTYRMSYRISKFKQNHIQLLVGTKTPNPIQTEPNLSHQPSIRSWTQTPITSVTTSRRHDTTTPVISSVSPTMKSIQTPIISVTTASDMSVTNPPPSIHNQSLNYEKYQWFDIDYQICSDGDKLYTIMIPVMDIDILFSNIGTDKYWMHLMEQ